MAGIPFTPWQAMRKLPDQPMTWHGAAPVAAVAGACRPHQLKNIALSDSGRSSALGSLSGLSVRMAESPWHALMGWVRWCGPLSCTT